VQKYAKQGDWTDTRQVADPKYPVLQSYLSVINEWLEGDLKESRKQRHTAKRVFTRLQKEQGYKGS
jgi:hypothetical protein